MGQIAEREDRARGTARLRDAGSLLLALVLGSALAGCAADTSPAPTHSVSATPSGTHADLSALRQAEYEHLINSGTLELPDGYGWPPDVPDAAYPGQNASVEDETLGIWGCIVIDAAWRAIDSGDPAEGERLIDSLYLTSDLWNADPIDLNTAGSARQSGWSGICTQMLDAIQYTPQVGTDATGH